MNFLILVTVIVIAVLVSKIASLLPDLTYQLRELQADVSAIRGALATKVSDDPQSAASVEGSSEGSSEGSKESSAFTPKDEGEANE